jgi:hypothetical protein
VIRLGCRSRAETLSFPRYRGRSGCRRRRLGSAAYYRHRMDPSIREAEGGDSHPHGHSDHHQVLGERDETERHVAGATDAGAFQLRLSI